MKVSESVQLYGNTRIHRTQNDIDFERYVKKLSLINSSLRLSFIRDNFGDYWLSNLRTSEMKDITFKIPGFVSGIIGTVSELQFTPIQIQNESEKDTRARLNSTNWDLKVYNPDFHIDNLIQYTNPNGTITLVGNGKRLKGNMKRLLNNVQAKKTQFKSFNIELITDLSMMFYGCDTNELDISGITFGQIESLEQAFRQSYIDNDIDLSEMDLQNCKNYNYCFHLSNGIKRVKFPRIKIDKDTQLKHVFQHQQDLEAVDMQLVTSDQIINQKSMFRDCPSIKSIDLYGVYDITNIETLIQNCRQLKEIILSRKGKTPERLVEIETILKKIQQLENLKVTWVN